MSPRLRAGVARVLSATDGGHDLAIALARDPTIVGFARELVRRATPGNHLSRVTAVFSFVAHLVEVPPAFEEEPRDGVDVLLALAGETLGPAVILSALLRALGERAPVREAGGCPFVAVELRQGDLARVPPHAALLLSHGRCSLPLDPRRSRNPLGFLPRPVRDALSRTRSGTRPGSAPLVTGPTRH
ncbi:MAG TPA: hypothetical protein VN083_00080 [Vicinamibacteria bacterium]|nr:hypothetical protein [Vicinamibacteria bacterium]